ncbi:MAG: methionine synthase [Thermoplasmatota archaeon]
MNVNKELITTVVGSFPSEPSKESLSKSYFTDTDPYLESLRNAVLTQIDTGIELISDGQTRGGMVEIFAGGLKGYRIKEKIEIISDIKFLSPITLQDQKLAKNMISKDVGLKGIITGPFTMVRSAENKHYRSEKNAVLDTAEALKYEAQELAKVCDVVQIDEPFISTEFPEYAQEAVETILDINTTTAIHICGNVNPFVEDLVEFDVDILDHEFADNPSLFEVYKDIDFSQRISVGVVSTDPRVESIDEIKTRINKAYEIFGANCMLDPDCGLKDIDFESAKSKLENMVQARDLLLKVI